MKKSIKCLKKLGSSGQQLNVTSEMYEHSDHFSSFYRTTIEPSINEFKKENVSFLFLNYHDKI